MPSGMPHIDKRWSQFSCVLPEWVDTPSHMPICCSSLIVWTLAWIELHIHRVKYIYIYIFIILYNYMDLLGSSSWRRIPRVRMSQATIAQYSLKCDHGFLTLSAKNQAIAWSACESHCLGCSKHPSANPTRHLDYLNDVASLHPENAHGRSNEAAAGWHLSEFFPKPNKKHHCPAAN